MRRFLLLFTVFAMLLLLPACGNMPSLLEVTSSPVQSTSPSPKSTATPTEEIKVKMIDVVNLPVKEWSSTL